MTTRKILYADDGKILTNGTDFGKIIYLAKGEGAGGWYEITEEEYNETIENENNNNNE